MTARGFLLYLGRPGRAAPWAGLAAAIVLSLGCSATPPVTDHHETLLLVSLQDGSVIQQTVSLDADICFKTNGVSATTCLTRGEPIFDGDAGAIIGYQMNSTQIELIPK